MNGSSTDTTPDTHAGAQFDRRRLGLLSFAHALTDSYGSSFISPLFPVLAEKLSLSYTKVGSLPTMVGLTASLCQPLIGLLSDRYPRVPLVAMGPAVSSLFLGLVGLAPNYPALLGVLVIAGFGAGAFHPQGARLASEAARGRGFAMSSFTVGGSVGFGLAPLLGAFYFHRFGLERWYVSAAPGLVLAGVLWVGFHRTFPRAARGALQAQDQARDNWPALAFLTATVAIRSLIPIGMTAFLPFYVEARGLPGVDIHTAKAIVVSALLLASGFAGPCGGHLTDRLGRRRVMIGSFLIAPWPLLAAFYLSGYAMVAALVLGGFTLMLPHPSNVIMAQEFLPSRASVAVSMITGFAWGLAVIMALGLGAIADHVGVAPMLRGLCLVPLLGSLFVLPIPERGR